MKWYYKLLIGLGIALIAYLIGNVAPIEYFKPTIIDKQIETSEYYQILIGSISAFVTFLAVVIALFKEDIRKFWVFSKITVTIPESNFIEVLKTNIGESANSVSVFEAEKYHCNIYVKNDGNIAAQDVEIYLESLTHSSQDFPTVQEIEINGTSLAWNHNNDSRINISPEGKKELCVVELKSPESQTSPTGEEETLPSKLIIAGHDNNPDYTRGIWTGTFAIFSSNSKPVRFKLQVNWNGRWERRVTEMSSNLSINLID